MRIIPSTEHVGDILVWVFKIVPSYTLTDSIMYESTKAQLVALRPDMAMSDFALDAIGGDILLACVHGGLWIIALVLIEARAFRWADRLFMCLRGKRIPPRTDLVLDQDVLKEEEDVSNEESKNKL